MLFRSETQGGRYDRSEENLGVSDVGIAMYRRLLKEQIDIVRNGGEPMGVIRDASKNVNIDLGVINDRIGLHRQKAVAE